MYERIFQPDEEHSSIPRSADVVDLVGQNRRISRAFKTLSAGKRTLLRASDEQVLPTEMCRVAVKYGNYLLPLVNFAIQDKSKIIRTKAHFGKNDGFIQALHLIWASVCYVQGVRPQRSVTASARP